MECKICDFHASVAACETTTRYTVVRCRAAAQMLNKTHHSQVYKQHSREKNPPKNHSVRAPELFGPLLSNIIKSCQVPTKAKSAFWQRINLKT